MRMGVCLIIPAGGNGQRFGGGLPKQFQLLNDVPIIIKSIRAFENVPGIDTVIISTMPHWISYTFDILKKFPVKLKVRIVNSGSQRQDSVHNALRSDDAQNSDIILIHDAVRPFPSVELIKKIIRTAKVDGAAIPGMIPKDTIKTIKINKVQEFTKPVPDAVNHVMETVNRNNLRSIQTPQGFRRDIINSAYEKAMKNKFYATDDASLCEYAGFPVTIVEGDDNNIKITTQLDYKLSMILDKTSEDSGLNI